MKYQKLFIASLVVMFFISIGKAINANHFHNLFRFERSTTDLTNNSSIANPNNNPNENIKTNPNDGSSSIKVALLLDTSGSMSGLIEQAKSQLWQILNQLADTEKQNGDEVDLEIALYEYGNPTSASSRKKQIRKLSAFTSDMDFISEKLFALTTNGGEEYCGQILWTSLDELRWGQNDNDLKMIYIAGNEPFTQGPVNYAEACRKARLEGVVVNTIFCGHWDEGVKTLWKQGAELGLGEYMNINHNERTVYVETPYDDKINELNSRLNETYIPYGKKGASKFRNQSTQDLNANSYSKSNSADRALFKSSKKYKADDWDLVDAYKKDKNVINNKEMMTDSLQNLTIEELEEKIEAARLAREGIQKEIQDTNIKRQEYIHENSKTSSDKKNLKNSIQKSIEKVAESKGYKIKK